jgi:cation:H+ antiporter
MEYILLVIGLVLLVIGAEALVRGASRLAATFGISPLVIGLTVVAFGTSAPEMAVSTVSCLAGQSNIALGNVIGSNIFNILLILGVSALVAPLVVSQQLIKLDVPLMIAVSALVYFFCIDGVISRPEGLLLFSGIFAYTAFLIRQSRRENKAVQEEYAREYGKKEPLSLKVLLKDTALILAGLGLLVLGSKWLVDGAVAIAQKLGVSELVIGLTIVAAGTSLPELATSVVASIRGERDIAVGNVVGSNLFNLLAVLGVAGVVSPSGIAVSPQVLHFDLPVMVAVAIACLPIFFTGSRISRREGALFLGGYIAYTAYLIFTAACG